MANTTFFEGLPNFDSPTLEDEIQAIVDSDRETLANLSVLMENFDWHQKIAIGQTAYFFIDSSHHQLLKLVPIHGKLSEPVHQAMRLVEKLSPQALAELASDILEEDFEGEIEVKDAN
ncbi:hypothetical protein Q5692_37825 [Microcoleus sp. C2C3]|uniref:hypothetical protein n=1 Tax=unclassified Microcoleus TaxID=2642155 RepID=UPI002FD4919D